MNASTLDGSAAIVVNAFDDRWVTDADPWASAAEIQVFVQNAPFTGRVLVHTTRWR